MWDNQGDAQMRISGCVVLFRGKPVRIQEVSAALIVTYSELGVVNPPVLEARLIDPGWDWKPIKCGYTNLKGGGCVYVQRIPRRRWKQGLHPDNVKTSNPRRHTGDIIYTHAFAKVIKGLYPAFDKVVKLVGDKKAKSQAFSRNYALSRNELGIMLLAYRGEDVGWYSHGEIELGDGYEFLKEDLQEVQEGKIA